MKYDDKKTEEIKNLKKDRNFEDITIGLEMHVQLNTKSKLFSETMVPDTDLPTGANSCVKYFDLGLPGILPKLNKAVIEKSILLGKALNCKINEYSRFDRKHYFYPDLPLGYQITQFYNPICEHGFLQLKNGKKIRINRIHIETDAGKMIHEGDISLLDYNRCSVPLLEVVTEPDFDVIEDVGFFIKELILILSTLNICDCNMEHGNVRTDANVSIRNTDGSLGIRSEIKNLNSIKFACDAIESEYWRQKNSTEKLTQTTRGYDVNTKQTFTMRDKEDAFDYKYVPDFNIPPIYLSQEYIHSIHLPELPGNKREKLKQFLNQELVEVLVSNFELFNLFEKSCGDLDNKNIVANLIINELVPLCKENDIQPYEEECKIKCDHIYDIAKNIAEQKITTRIARIILQDILETGEKVNTIIKNKNLEIISDINTIKNMLQDIVKNNEKKWQEFLSGEDKVSQFFIGQCMKISGGKINPEIVMQALNNMKNI